MSKVEKATIPDVAQMHQLINNFADKGEMLARPLSELYENIRDFWVSEERGKITACCALHISWDDLAEIKALAVAKEKQGKGLGAELIDSCLREAKLLGAKKIFVLTYKPEYFKRFGFKRIKHANLPHKIWAECINCCKFPDCEETALLKEL